MRFYLYRPFGPSVAAAVSASLVAIIIVLTSAEQEPLSSPPLLVLASCQLVPTSCRQVPISSPLADFMACLCPLALVYLRRSEPSLLPSYQLHLAFSEVSSVVLCLDPRRTHLGKM